MLFYGIDHKFHAKKWGAEFFFRSKGDPEKFS